MQHNSKQGRKKKRRIRREKAYIIGYSGISNRENTDIRELVSKSDLIGRVESGIYGELHVALTTANLLRKFFVNKW